LVADYQAFERFRDMNASAKATDWSREREAFLRKKLTNELGDLFEQLECWGELNNDRKIPEDFLLTAKAAPRSPDLDDEEKCYDAD
jgi:hypothetical protein